VCLPDEVAGGEMNLRFEHAGKGSVLFAQITHRRRRWEEGG